jgi:hypothetical protein
VDNRTPMGMPPPGHRMPMGMPPPNNRMPMGMPPSYQPPFPGMPPSQPQYHPGIMFPFSQSYGPTGGPFANSNQSHHFSQYQPYASNMGPHPGFNPFFQQQFESGVPSARVPTSQDPFTKKRATPATPASQSRPSTRAVPHLAYHGSTGVLRLVTLGFFYGRAVRCATGPPF